jgi:iron complex outermembrane receptor protein
MAQLNRFSIVSLLALSLAMPAMAQVESGPQPPADEGQDRASRDVVVITAQKREETVQDTALAVTAITSELRDEIGLTTVQDYTNFAPGLTYSTSNDRLGMRGVTRTSNNFGIRSGISNYVDGVYFSSAIPASREPIFVERVEVVRGPQGTLYGRDSIGGALNVITKRPTEEFEGQVNFQVGDYDTRAVQGTFAGPITDWMRYRIGYSRSVQNEGFLTNYATGDTEGGRRDDTYIEGQLEFDIGEDLDLWIRAGSLGWDVRYGAPGARTSGDDASPYDTRLFPPGAIVPNGGFAFSGVPTGFNMVGNQTTNPGITDDRGFNTNFANFAHLWPTQEYAIEAVYHLDNFDIKYLGGYVFYHYNLQQDNDGGPATSFNFNGRTYLTDRVSDYNEDRTWYSNEINVVSTFDGPLQLIGGLYQYQENYTQPIYVSERGSVGGYIQRLDHVQAFNFSTPQPDLPDFTGRNSSSGSQIGGDLYFHTNNQGLNNAYGAFLQADYELNDEWKVTGGIRWSQDTSNTTEYARLITLYSTEAALEAGLAPFAGLVGGVAALNALVQPRIDVTRTLGGPDPTTVNTSNPCGFAAQGVVNANPTTANGGTGCGGPNDRSRYGIYLDPVTGNAYRDLAGKWEEVTGVIGVDWTPDSDTLIYGKYNRGYKPGGLGCAATFCLMVPTPYTDKELVDAFELGFKRTWPEWDLTTNATLFFYDYQGYQISNTIVPDDPDGDAGPLPRPPAYAAYVNLPETNTTGFELETMWYPTDNFRLILNYGWTNPEIGDTPSLIHALDPFARDPDAQPLGAVLPNGQQGQNLNGNILPFSPKHKVALNGTYTWDFEDGSTLDGSLSYFWQDISYNSVFNRWSSKIPAWDQVDARLSWTSADGNISLIGFVRNLLDENQWDSRNVGLRQGNNRNVDPGMCGTTTANTISHAVNPLGVLAEDCFTVSNTYRPPRTIGAELQIRF